MADAGLINGVNVTLRATLFPHSVPICITWQGYEFQAVMKDDSTWKKSKATVLAKSVPWVSDRVLHGRAFFVKAPRLLPP